MCGMINSSVLPRIMYVDNDDPGVLVASVSISSKNRMTISTLFMKLNLYGLVIARKQVAHAIRTLCISDVYEGKRL